MYQINNKTKQITLTKGDTLKLEIQIMIDGEVYTPNANDSLRFAMKKSYKTSNVLINKPIPIETRILHIEPQDTKRLYSGEYVYDIQITFENGDVDTFIKGRFILEPQVE